MVHQALFDDNIFDAGASNNFFDVGDRADIEVPTTIVRAVTDRSTIYRADSKDTTIFRAISGTTTIVRARSDNTTVLRAASQTTTVKRNEADE